MFGSLMAWDERVSLAPISPNSGGLSDRSGIAAVGGQYFSVSMRYIRGHGDSKNLICVMVGV